MSHPGLDEVVRRFHEVGAEVTGPAAGRLTTAVVGAALASIAAAAFLVLLVRVARQWRPWGGLARLRPGRLSIRLLALLVLLELTSPRQDAGLVSASIAVVLVLLAAPLGLLALGRGMVDRARGVRPPAASRAPYGPRILKGVRRFALGAAFLGGGLVLWCLTGAIYAGLADRRAGAEARGTEGVVSGANPSARRLEELGARLGVELAPEGAPGRPRPGQADREALESLSEPLADFLVRRCRRPDDELDGATPGLREGLARHGAALDEVRRHLLEAPPPAWEHRPDAPLDEAPVPRLAQHLLLQRLLLLRALEESRAGRGEAALASIEASFRLNQALETRSEVASQLVAALVARLEAGLLRKLDGVPESWGRRLTAMDFPGSLARAADTESLGLLELQRRGRGLFALGPRFLRPFRLAADPYARLSLLEHRARLRTTLSRLRDTTPCEAVARIRSGEFGVKTVSWDIVGLAAWPGLEVRSALVLRTTLDLELTALLLRAKAVASSAPALVRRLPSTVCSGEAFVVRVEDGWVRELTFTGRVVDLTVPRHALLPLRYVGRRGRGPRP